MPNPAFAAWQHSGRPEPINDYPKKYIISGQCSHCGQVGNVVLAKRVVSKVFTNWDHYSNIDKPVWCNPCIWAFSEKNNRSEAIAVINDTMYTCYQIQSLKELFKTSLSEKSFVSVALKKNKHVLPYAQWGHVRIEDLTFRWAERESNWLITIEYLNSMGFALGDIKNDDSPSSFIIATISKEDAKKVYTLWETLAPLRKLPQLFNFMLELNKNSTMEYKTTSIKE